MSTPRVVAFADRAAVDGDDAGAERVEQDPIRGTVGGHARERVDTGGVVEGERGAGGGRDRALLLRVERGTGRDPSPTPLTRGSHLAPDGWGIQKPVLFGLRTGA